MNQISETMRLILGRRSFRAPFADRDISDDIITSIVQCGLSAPASKNAPPCRFHVVTNRALLSELADIIARADGADTYVPINPDTGAPRSDWASTVGESASVLGAAPAVIFIENVGPFSGGRATLAAAPHDLLADNLFTYSLEVIGVGAAIMNMWIAALSLGVQATFMGDICVAEKAIADRLGLSFDLAGALVLGYPATGVAPLPPKALDETRIVWRR